MCGWVWVCVGVCALLLSDVLTGGEAWEFSGYVTGCIMNQENPGERKREGRVIVSWS